MGARLRLKPTFQCGLLGTDVVRVICTAMQRYGLILADVGSSWYLTGEASQAWEDPELFGAMESARRDAVMADFDRLTGSQMEVVTIDGALGSWAPGQLDPRDLQHTPDKYLPIAGGQLSIQSSNQLPCPEKCVCS
jgi:hypothetical protein